MKDKALFNTMKDQKNMDKKRLKLLNGMMGKKSKVY